MIDCVKSLAQMQEEHSTGHLLVHVGKYTVNKVQETCTSGVALPEPGLARRQQIIYCEIVI